jgi:hypothetical protein
LKVEIFENVHNMLSIDDKLEYCLKHIIKIAREDLKPNSVMRDYVNYIKTVLNDTVKKEL